MALADRGAKVAPKSKFQLWIDGLSDEHREIVVGWLRDPWYSQERVVQMIRDDDEAEGFVGYKAGKDTIGKWRRENNVVG